MPLPPEFEKRLWDAADQLWTNTSLKPSEYATPVLALIFLRYADQRFAEATKELEKKRRRRGGLDKIDTDVRKVDLSPDWGALTDIARGLRGLEQPVDITQVMSAVDRLLDESVAAKAFVMRDSPEEGEPSRIDLGKIDFDALKRFFDKSEHKAASTEALIVATRDRVARLVHLNPTRVSLRERFEEMIAEYNAGRLNVADFFRELLAFMKKVEAEEARASTEGLTVEQLPVYDLLLAKGGKPSARDRKLLKTIAKKLPRQIAPKLVIDWRKGQQSRAAVRVAIRDALDDLPKSLFDDTAFDKVVEEVFEHVYESYWGEGKSKYAEEPG